MPTTIVPGLEVKHRGHEGVPDDTRTCCDPRGGFDDPAYPEDLPAFLEWVAEAIIFVVVVPIALFIVWALVIRPSQSGAEDLLEWIIEWFTGGDK